MRFLSLESSVVVDPRLFRAFSGWRPHTRGLGKSPTSNAVTETGSAKNYYKQIFQPVCSFRDAMNVSLRAFLAASFCTAA